MTRSSRLMAAMLAALFAAVLASPAYATGTGTCAPHSRTTGSGCKAEGTKFHDLDADGKRDSGEPGLAGFRIWADYDDDGVRDSGEPYDDTDAAGHYLITGIYPPAGATTSARRYRLREQLSTGSGTGDWACSYPNASTAGGFASGAGSGFSCGWGPIDATKTSHATNQDFGNYRKAKVTVIKDLNPATDSGRFDLKVDGATVKAAAGDGGTGSVLVKPGAHQVTETAASGTSLADYAASTSCKTTIGPRTYGPDWVHPGSGDQVVCTITNVRHGKVEIAKQTDPHETGGAAFGFSGFAGAFSLADGGLKTITHVTPRSEPYTVTESAAAGYRLSALTCNDGDSSGALDTRTASIRVAPGETVRCMFVNTKLAPAIEVVKAGPDRVHHGDKMEFTFAVRNVGNSPLHTVNVTDDRCAPVSAAPVTKTGDDGDSLLEAGEVWIYSCSKTVPPHAAGESDPLCNTATAAGQDEQDRPVTDTDKHCTDILHPAIAADPPAQQQVLAATERRQARPSARLRGPSGCVYRPFGAVVSGRQIRRVTFFVDGRRVARRTARSGQRRFTARIRPGTLRPGVHRVTARVVFRRGARPRTLVLSFQRCVAQDPSPRFTG